MKSYDDFIEFSLQEETDVTLEEPVEEQYHLFKRIKYFKDDIVLPFMNPEYGEGRYDGRFDNSEFFKDDIRIKLKQYLKEKTK